MQTAVCCYSPARQRLNWKDSCVAVLYWRKPLPNTVKLNIILVMVLTVLQTFCDLAHWDRLIGLSHPPHILFRNTYLQPNVKCFTRATSSKSHSTIALTTVSVSNGQILQDFKRELCEHGHVNFWGLCAQNQEFGKNMTNARQQLLSSALHAWMGQLVSSMSSACTPCVRRLISCAWACSWILPRDSPFQE